MSGQAQEAQDQAPRQPFIYGVLSGELAAKYGPLPMVPLPQEDELLLGFVQNMAHFLRNKGLYRRDDVIVVVDEKKKRLVAITAKAFCSWTQHIVATCKTKYDANGDPYEVVKDMPTEVAEKVLLSFDFLESLPEIEDIHPVPLPTLDEGGISLLDEGHDRGILSFGVD